MLQNRVLWLLLILGATTTLTTDAWQVGPLLSTCIDACQRGCDQIRAVQAQRTGNNNNNDNSDNDASILQVSMKNVDDSRSALTIADQAAQRAIVDALRQHWGPELRIIGEEDEPTITVVDDNNNNNGLVTDAYIKALDTTLLDDDLGESSMDWDPRDVCIFVDPLDGTREFVQGRIENCQVLVGITYKGEAMAGAIGIPFPITGKENFASTPATIVYGLADVGTGFIGTPLTRGPFPLDKYADNIKYPRPHHATGDRDNVDAIQGACQSIIGAFGGSRVTYGGAGNKILAACLGEVACSFQHIVGGPWDLCAPHAIAKAMGAGMTDFFGDEIRDIYQPEKNASSSSMRCRERGYLVSSPGSDHQALVKVVQKSPQVQEYRRSVEGKVSQN